MYTKYTEAYTPDNKHNRLIELVKCASFVYRTKICSFHINSRNLSYNKTTNSFCLLTYYSKYKINVYFTW